MTADPTATIGVVNRFWKQAGPERWFEMNADFDREVRARFLPTYEAAVAGRLDDWEDSAEGAFARLIVLDQFPRNMFRGTAKAFATDALARDTAVRAIERGFDRAYEPPLRNFFYMPFMHSEEVADQERCLAHMEELGDANAIKYAEIHLDAIRRFGRFPHRNEMLGRATTPAEQAYLDGGGFRG